MPPSIVRAVSTLQSSPTPRVGAAPFQRPLLLLVILRGSGSSTCLLQISKPRVSW
jgi:hypothetical protein